MLETSFLPFASVFRQIKGTTFHFLKKWGIVMLPKGEKYGRIIFKRAVRHRFGGGGGADMVLYVFHLRY